MKNAIDEDYSTPLTPDLFAAAYGYPPAMVRLAIECGLKSTGGKITGIAFCRWFTAHYNDLRERAGLPLLDTPTKGMPAGERRPKGRRPQGRRRRHSGRGRRYEHGCGRGCESRDSGQRQSCS